MAKNKLFEDAIADAKAMRQVALANAKMALEEAITPRLQSMISAKLMEADDEELDEAKEDVDEGLDQFLSELQDDESGLGDRNAIDENDEEDTDETDELSDEAPKSDDDGSEPAEDVKISDLSIEEFKEIIRDVVQSEMGGGEGAGLDAPEGDDFSGEEGGLPDMGDDAELGDDDDAQIDELLAELDSLNEDDAEELDEAEKITAKKRPVNGINAKGGNANLGSSKSGYKPMKQVAPSKQLEEATKTIKHLRKDLQEINLLNAKLLYVNTIFKGNNQLTEGQKLRVIESFDRATNPKEAKFVFETLKENLKKSSTPNKAKNQLKESLNFASRTTGSTAPKTKGIVADSTVERFKKLANIK